MTNSSQKSTVLIDRVVLNGRPSSVYIANGLIVGIDDHIPMRAVDQVLDGRGGRILPGLADHHLHLFATAAQADSVDVSSCRPGDVDELRARIAERSDADRVRAVGLDDGSSEILHRIDLDAICPTKPLRVQYRTGGLWVLNSAALDCLPKEIKSAAQFERDSGGNLTGRVWRGDALLRDDRAYSPPNLAFIGRLLARWGVTSITDASVTNDQAQAQQLGKAARALPQRVTIMGQEALSSENAAWSVGPRKILLDEANLPDFDATISTVKSTHREYRRVAFHCVTVTELLFALAVLRHAGVADGDRIEHGTLIPDDVIVDLAEMELTVVAQPGFLLNRGDRYHSVLTSVDKKLLLRLQSLRRAGVRLAAGSDAPYGPLNPWLAMMAAVDRCSQSGVPLNIDEALSAEQALALYLGAPSNPGIKNREITINSPADLIILKPGARVGIDDDPVALTIIGGNAVYQDGSFLQKTNCSASPLPTI